MYLSIVALLFPFFVTIAFKCYWQLRPGYFDVSLTFIPNPISTVFLFLQSMVLWLWFPLDSWKGPIQMLLIFSAKNDVSEQSAYGYCLFWPFCVWNLVLCSSWKRPLASLSWHPFYWSCTVVLVVTNTDLVGFNARNLVDNDNVSLPPLFLDVALI